MSLRRAKSVDHHVEWGRQAVVEVTDLSDCMESESEDVVGFPAVVDPLQEGIQALCAAMTDGSHSWGCADMPFMDLSGKHAEEIPFHTLLNRSTRSTVVVSALVGAMPETGAMKMAERESDPTPRLEG